MKVDVAKLPLKRLQETKSTCLLILIITNRESVLWNFWIIVVMVVKVTTTYSLPIFLIGCCSFSRWFVRILCILRKFSVASDLKASLVAQIVKNPPAMRETWVWSLGWDDPLEEGMATYFSILAWRISMDRVSWWATVHGIAELDMTEQLKHSTANDLKCHFYYIPNSKSILESVSLYFVPLICLLLLLYQSFKCCDICK